MRLNIASPYIKQSPSEGLSSAHNALVGIRIRDQVRIIASGKAITAFHMLRLMTRSVNTINSMRVEHYHAEMIKNLREQKWTPVDTSRLLGGVTDIGRRERWPVHIPERRSCCCPR